MLGHLGALLILAALGLSLWYLVSRRERYRPGPPPAPHRMVPTSEVHIDPETGRRERVWVDPGTGARSFVDEAVAPPGGLPAAAWGAPPVPHVVGWGATAPRIRGAAPSTAAPRQPDGEGASGTTTPG